MGGCEGAEEFWREHGLGCELVSRTLMAEVKRLAGRDVFPKSPVQIWIQGSLLFTIAAFWLLAGTLNMP